MRVASSKTNVHISIPPSPLRSNTFVKGNNVSGNSTRNNSKKSQENKSQDQRRGVESGDDRGSPLNLELIGSPAPRSQVRALVSSGSMIPKCKHKPFPLGRSKSREQTEIDPGLEKIYRFADNPTEFVRSENERERQLKLDLEFSDRSDESDNYYNSHNIAFGEDGVYRIPEYDHIRYLEFNVGETREEDPTIREEQFFETGRTIATESEREVDQNSGKSEPLENLGESLSLKREDLVASGTVDEIEGHLGGGEASSWNSRRNYRSTNYPLGSVDNYKNNINPMVGKFMLDTGPDSMLENYQEATTNANNVSSEDKIDEGENKFEWRTGGEQSVDNTSKSSAETSDTTLSESCSSSKDGTWHEHSLNSPYFASSEMTGTETAPKTRTEESNGATVTPYPGESEQYLTILREEDRSVDSVRSTEYIFLTDRKIRFEEDDEEEKRDEAREKDREEGELATGSEPKISGRDEEIRNRDTDSESISDYGITNLFSKDVSSEKVPMLVAKREEDPSRASSSHCMGKIVRARDQVDRLTRDHRGALFITTDELDSATDYANKLSEIFDRVRARSERNGPPRNRQAIEPRSYDTPRLISNCLESSNFHSNHPSS